MHNSLQTISVMLICEIFKQNIRIKKQIFKYGGTCPYTSSYNKNVM